MMTLPQKFLIIDEHGYPLIGKTEAEVGDETRASEQEGSEILRHLHFAENGAFETELFGQKYLVEAFDEPFIAQAVLPPKKNERTALTWKIQLPYGVEKNFRIQSLRADDWDRFHGVTSEDIPFLLSKEAQAQLFEIAEFYDDESITFDGKTIEIPHLFSAKAAVVENADFWNQIYVNETPKWDLGQPSPILTELLTRLKIPKSRVLVLGCGTGHDAAHIASQGHFVTAVDFSPEAIQKAKALYGKISNLQFVQQDIFKLPRDWEGQFDLIFEQTCYCAIDPARREALVKIWRRMLAPNGHLLGIFFTMERKNLPPFGATEWEIRKRLRSDFHVIFWGRWRNSIADRNGKELAVYLQKKSV